MLLGAAVPAGSESLLDLGAGVGTAALVSLATGRAARADLVERDLPTAELARANLAANDLAGRGRVIAVDVAAKAELRRSAGLQDNAYDIVIANPPFFGTGQGTLATDASRADARHMDEQSLDLWLRCTAGSARANGTAIVIYPASGLGALLAAFSARFGAMTVLPLAPREGADASRVLVRGTKGSKAPLRLLPTRVMHLGEGNAFSPQFDAIFRGEAALDW
ncbi:tRNA1(Val) (adenine(37)-N6)-methyltransferase [Devosia lucknowensis]|uniref:tRNA1(Val) (adenine(37)-N6)-methyltransferase n=1 Tax=Devosia lucknowensis TaxID=1096929 RepID=UPI0014834407|nr:methyltransferase [Devosia lucknowensis]